MSCKSGSKVTPSLDSIVVGSDTFQLQVSDTSEQLVTICKYWGTLSWEFGDYLLSKAGLSARSMDIYT